MVTYAKKFFEDAGKVAEMFPGEYRDFCEAAASAAIWGGDPVEIAQKRLERASARYSGDPLEIPVTENGEITIRGILGKRGIR